MSAEQNGKVLSAKITDRAIAALVASALRSEYANSDAAVKRIERRTGISSNSICKWYQGRNTPKSAHLLVLAKHYPAVLRVILELIGRADLWQTYEYRASYLETRAIDYSASSCPITAAGLLPAAKLNWRQLWIIDRLHCGHNIKIGDIVSVWHVSPRTAKYDMAKLTKLQLIQFLGPKKTGKYVLCVPATKTDKT